MNNDLLIDNETKISYFNPFRRVLKNKIIKIKFFKYLFPKTRLNNFGDLLGPIIVKAFLNKSNISLKPKFMPNKFLTVGSILHYASEGDYIWGSGINGKKINEKYSLNNLNIFLVRGPMTRNFLVNLGLNCPELYGDPAILFSDLFPEYQNPKRGESKVLFIPNYNEEIKNLNSKTYKIISPLEPLSDIIQAITSSGFVISSSLHAVIIAESYGIGARFLEVKNESSFKYIDYLQGTGRFEYTPAESIEKAIELGPQPKPIIDKNKILDSFPKFLYSDN